MADLEDKKVSELEHGSVTSNSKFLDSGLGVSTQVTAGDIANFVAKVQAYQGAGGLVTLAKTLVGAINELANSAGKSNFADLDDVDIDDQTLDEGQVPVWDSVNEKWVNGEVNPVSAFEDLTDVDIDDQTLTDGQVPIYNSTTQKWENGDVSGGGASANEALPYDATATYSIGDYCINNQVLYRCITAISTPEAFDSTKWTAVLITGEYKRVRVMHKAEFDLLTPDEKADGMIFVDDVDITADDVPYSQGVSVADMLTPEVVTTVAAGSAVATGSYILACYRVGKIVQVYIVGSANSTFVGGTSEIMTGLPKPKDTTIRYPITKTSAGSPYGFGTTYQVSIDANGVMTPTYIPSGAIASGDYWFSSFSYIAE